MKRVCRILSLTLSFVLMLSCLSVGVLADNETITVKVPYQADSKTVSLNGSSGFPYLDGKTVLIPLRAVGEAMGLAVSWDAENNATVLTKNGSWGPEAILNFPVGADICTVVTITMDMATTKTTANTNNIKMPAATSVKNGRTYAPADTVANVLGYVTEWDKAANILTIKNDWDTKTAGYMKLFYEEYNQARYLANRPQCFEAESFAAYQNLADTIRYTLVGATITDENVGMIYALKSAREKLVQTSDLEEGIWYIWGEENMPKEAAAADYDFSTSWDNADFKPFLVPYLLEDQSTVKGNIIVIAGGGYSQRANSYEGYPIAIRFNNLGYNTYVLQRRVTPYTRTDTHLDLQRSIRYIRYNAEKYGIAKTENMAAVGFSGGAMTICGTIADCYGYEKPTKFYPNYECDEIDEVNSDLQTAILVYGATVFQTENPNIPDCFLVQGTEDHTVPVSNHMKFLQYCMDNNIRYEFHFIADLPHGFGAGDGLHGDYFIPGTFPTANTWTISADEFMSTQWGYTSVFVPDPAATGNQG